MASIHRGDVLVRAFGLSFELVDAVTHEQIAIVPSINYAIRIAIIRHGLLWQENVDNRGRTLGEPVLLTPQMVH